MQQSHGLLAIAKLLVIAAVKKKSDVSTCRPSPQQSATDVAVHNTTGSGLTKNDRTNVSTPRADEQRNTPSSSWDVTSQARKHSFMPIRNAWLRRCRIRSDQDLDLLPLTLKTFLEVPTHMMNICATFH